MTSNAWPPPTGLPCCVVRCPGIKGPACFCVTLNLSKRKKGRRRG